ncbi:MAG: hypothetical protein AB7S26_42935 [Sandaracinaceae bacterium]
MVRPTSAPRGHCVECGGPLEGEYWMTRYPDGVHARCRRWEREPWPFDRELEALRGARRRVARLLHDIDELGRWMVARRAEWPTNARAVAEEAAGRVKALRDRLRLR